MSVLKVCALRQDVSERQKIAEKLCMGVVSVYPPRSNCHASIGDKNKSLSLTGLTTPGRPVLVFCSKCRIARDVCCRSSQVD